MADTYENVRIHPILHNKHCKRQSSEKNLPAWNSVLCGPSSGVKGEPGTVGHSHGPSTSGDAGVRVTFRLRRECELGASLGYRRLREGESRSGGHMSAMPALWEMDVRGHPVLHSKGHPALHSKKALLTK